MAEQLATIDALPAHFGALAAGFRSAALQMARHSAEGIPHSLLPANVFIRGGNLETRLFITRTDSHLFFGFIRREETAVIMDAAVNLRFEITEREFRGVPIKPESILHIAIGPRFFLVSLPDPEVRAAAKALGADPKEIFFLQLDAGILGVVRPDNLSLAKVVWQWRPGADWERADEDIGPGSPHSRKWRVPPFLALARTVGLWIKGGFDSGQPLPVSLPAQPEQSSEKTALYLLRQLTSAWIHATNEIQNRAGDQEEIEVALQGLMPVYEAAGFEAKVLLRLDSDGQLALKGDRDDLFLLQATLRLGEDEKGVAHSRISIGPPDFLGGGPLYDAFLDCLEDSATALRLASQLGLEGQEFAIRDFVRSARSRPLDAPLVFRVKQGKFDTDVITLHGTLITLPQHVVLRADFQVELGDEPKVSIRAKSLEVLYTDRPRGGSAEGHGTDLVEYFLRLLTNLRNWHHALT